jgi:hypothetical protein
MEKSLGLVWRGEFYLHGDRYTNTNLLCLLMLFCDWVSVGDAMYNVICDATGVMTSDDKK